MNKHPYLLISLTEGEKKALLIIFIIVSFIFLLVGLIVKGIRSYQEVKGKAVDGYMYDLVKFGIIKTPNEFRKYVYKRETRQLYLSSRWMFRVFILATTSFIIYVTTALDGNFDECVTLITNLFPELSWPKTEMFGMQIVCDWPEVVRPASAELSLRGYVTYIYALVLLYTLIKLIRDILVFTARLNRSSKVSNSSFGKNLDNGVDRIDE